MISRRTLAATVLGAVGVVTLAACGSSEPATDSAASTTTAGQAISVTDSRGKTITLAKPAQRVVTLEWLNTEDVVTLGVQPVAVADPKGYSSWVTAAPLTGNPANVGLRTEPSLESVANANPDLIVGIENSIPSNAIAQMEKIAPVVLLKGADASHPLDLMRENFTTTAKLLGKEDVAATKLAAFDADLAAAKTKLAAKQGQPYALTYISVTGNTVDLRMHSARSLPGAIAAELGLKNSYTQPGDDAYGIGSLDLEGLTKLPANTEILYWGNKTVDDPVTGALQSNAIWKALPEVQNGLVHRVGDGVWFYGGPASAEQWIAQLTQIFG